MLGGEKQKVTLMFDPDILSEIFDRFGDGVRSFQWNIMIGYKLNRYQVTKVEVETVEQEQAVKMLNRDTDRFAKSEDTYRERYASLDEMYEESGFEPADDSPTPEEQFLENEKNKAIKRLVAKAMEELTEKQKTVIYKTFWEEKTLREIC